MISPFDGFVARAKAQHPARHLRVVATDCGAQIPLLHPIPPSLVHERSPSPRLTSPLAPRDIARKEATDPGLSTRRLPKGTGSWPDRPRSDLTTDKSCIPPASALPPAGLDARRERRPDKQRSGCSRLPKPRGIQRLRRGWKYLWSAGGNSG